MPIIDIQIVAFPNEALAEGLTQALATALGQALGEPEANLWVRLHILPSSHYAENCAPLPSSDLPVFVTVLLARPPTNPQALQAHASVVCSIVAAATGRSQDRVHIEYSPPGSGRIAFGGKFQMSAE